MAKLQKKQKRIVINLNGKRRYIRITQIMDGKKTQSQQRLITKVFDWITELEVAFNGGFAPDQIAVANIRRLDWLTERCVKFGLMPKTNVLSVQDLVDDYFNYKEDQWQESTKEAWRRAEPHIVSILGGDTLLRDINKPIADKFKATLQNTPQRRSKTGKLLAKATVSKIVSRVRELFRYGVNAEYILANPFAHIKRHASDEAKPESRQFEVSEQIIRHVMNVASSAEWRLYIAMLRWGGARKSEPLEMKVSDIHLDGEFPLMNVYDVKESNRDKGIVVKRNGVPVFDEIMPELLDALEQHNGTSEWLFPTLRGYGDSIDKPFKDLVRKAGYEPWPAIFNNIRTARSNEIAREYGHRYLKPWLGHTQKTHEANYKTMQKADYEKVFGTGSYMDHSGGLQSLAAESAEIKKGQNLIEKSSRPSKVLTSATPTGFEPATTGSTVRYSNQLSYRA